MTMPKGAYFSEPNTVPILPLTGPALWRKIHALALRYREADRCLKLYARVPDVAPFYRNERDRIGAMLRKLSGV